MMKCPACGIEQEDGVLRCEACGNPLAEGRPWDAKTKSQLELDAIAEEEAQKRRLENKNKIKVQQSMNKELRSPVGNSKVTAPDHLGHEFVVGKSLCGFSEKPGDKKNMSSGTVVLTKEALIFGASEYAIERGHYRIEIPMEIVESFGESSDGKKKLIAVRTFEGEVFYLFVGKREEWMDYFRFVLQKEDQPDEMAENGAVAFGKKILTFVFLIFAVLCLAITWLVDLQPGMNLFCSLLGLLFFGLSAFSILGKRKDTDK